MSTGFFGKIPTGGDFVARGLTDGARGDLDRWLSRWLAPHAALAGRWPESGVRAAIETRAGALALLVLPSEDYAGRAFPLAAAAPLGRAGRADVDGWADTALFPLDAAVAGEITATELSAALAGLDDPASGDRALALPSVWAAKAAPRPPEVALPGLVSA